MLSAAATVPTREQRLWSGEVARVRAAASTLEPAARRAVQTTLLALAADVATDETTRADVFAMLCALERGAATPDRHQPRGLAPRLAGLRDAATRGLTSPVRSGHLAMRPFTG